MMRPVKLKKLIKKPFRFVRRHLIRFGYFPVHNNPIGKIGLSKVLIDGPIFGRVSFAQQGEDLVLERIFLRILNIDLSNYKGVYIDVGAYHPVSHSTTCLLHKRGWFGVCVDISSSSCNIIKRRRTAAKVYNCAISNKTEFVQFEDSGMMSLISNVSPIEGDNEDSGVIQAYLLSSILSDAIIHDVDIDYINIDIEGYELKALEGAQLLKYNPRVISVEIHSDSVLSALNSPVSKYLHDNGYKCVASTVITYFFIKE